MLFNKAQMSLRLFLPLLSVLLVALPSITQARLGDTEDQAESRYGLPRKEPARPTPLLQSAREVCYRYDGWVIRCAYVTAVDGVDYIVRQEYQKVVTPAILKSGGTATIRDFEVEAILAGENNGTKWRDVGAAVAIARGLPREMGKTGQPVGGKVFQRPDGARAVVSKESDRVQLDLPQALKYEAAAKALHVQEQRTRLPEF